MYTNNNDVQPNIFDALMKVGPQVSLIKSDPNAVITIGAAAYGTPDLVIAAKIPDKALLKLAKLSLERFRASNMRFGLHTDIIGQLSVLILPCDIDLVLLKETIMYDCEQAYRYEKVHRSLSASTPEYAQIIIPDDEGYYPWQTDYNTAQKQPVFTSKRITDYT